MSIIFKIRRALLSASVIAGLAGASLLGGVANAATTNNGALSATQQQHLLNIKTKGDAEITRRLTTLNTLSSRISAMTKLTASDKSYLVAELNTEISGLTSLKTQLDADTTLAAAETDAQSIIDEYRVYRLVVPKVQLTKTADDQQATESQLTALAQKLQTRITAAQTAGKNVSTMQSDLNAMTAQTNAAQSISSAIEQKVLTLQPSDYDADPTILNGDATQLKTAHSDNQAAYASAKTVIGLLKNL